MAEGILRNAAIQKGIPIQVASAGTAAYHVGEPAHELSVSVAKEFGVDISNHMAQQFQVIFFDEYDLILVMDQDHKRSLLTMARNENDKAKIKFYRQDQSIIEDPYYGGKSDYIRMYHRLLEDADHWVKR